jgi:hypothetical protein
MGDVSKEAIADVNSTLKVEFPISGLQDFGAATKTWTFKEKKYTIPVNCKYVLSSDKTFF